MVGVEAQQAVGIVLHDEDALAHADLGDDRAPFQGEGDPSGVVVVRDDVDELDGLPRGARIADRFDEGLGNQAVLVHGDVDDVGLARAEDAEGAYVRGGLGEDDVAWVDEELGDQVERLLAPRGDDDVVGIGADDAVVGHDLGDPFAQDLPALPVPVLHGLRSVPGDEALGGGGELVERQVLEIGHSAGQGNDFGP